MAWIRCSCVPEMKRTAIERLLMAVEPGLEPALMAAGDEDGQEGDGGPVTGLLTKPKPRTKKPSMYKVLMLNDDYTPMEFVVALLEQVFHKPPVEATALMLQIHRSGSGVAGVYALEVAETKVATVHRMAEERGYPLRSGLEPE